MAVITITREVGTGGRELGKLLAEKLGYQYVDKTLLQRVADELNVSENALHGFERSREFRISNLFLKMYSKNYIERIVGHDKSVVEENDYQKSLRNLIRGIAADDNVVILGRAAYCFLQDLESAYHVRLIAPLEWRRRYVVEQLGISPESVGSYIDRRDKNRLWFHRSMCGDECYDPARFHLVVNMARVSMNRTLKAVLALVSP